MENTNPSLQKAVEKTIRYARKFGGGLDRDELWTRLISNRAYSKEAVYKEADKIKLPTGRSKQFAKEKVRKAKDFVEKTRWMGQILMIGISGSVAAGYPSQNDDIDLVMVTKKDSLWLTRLMVWLTAKAVGKKIRRYGKKEEKDAICLNMWLEEDCLEIPKGRRNLRSAVDLILLRPILDRGEIKQKMLEQNKWAKKYVATGFGKEVKNRPTKGAKDTKPVGRLINEILYRVEKWYMRGKITSERVNKKQAMFHGR